MKTERIVAVVPAYQAAATVGAVVRDVREHVAEVLVVDDGSTDGTADAARAAGARVLVHDTNFGKGFALCTAFAVLAEEDVDGAVTIDADGQHDTGEIAKLVAARDADLVLGVRSHLFESMSGLRRASNRASSWIISKVAGADVCDVQTGFRLYRRSMLEADVLRPGRFESETEVVVRAARRGLSIACIPVALAEVDGRATSHFRPLVDAVRIARAVARARWGPDRAPVRAPRSTR